jgi:hypothetical protein
MGYDPREPHHRSARRIDQLERLMGLSSFPLRKGVIGLCLLAVTGAATTTAVVGCQTGPTLATRKLAQHQATLDKDGLNTTHRVADLKVTCAPPHGWQVLPTNHAALYTHQQWRSPTRATGVGVIYAKLPIPLPVSTLLWFAKQEYTKKQADGRLIAQWTDKFGRSWFEAENNKYHVKGYAVVQGTDAWFVYSGYRMTMAQNPDEIELATRCQDTVLIQPKAPPEPAAANVATAAQ